jgi:acyl-CoA thioester hydrolase
MTNPDRNQAATTNRVVVRAEPTPRSDFRFAHRLRVRWSEVDPQGIVFNPNYFVYADVGFTEYMRDVGVAYPQDLHATGSDLFTVAAAAHFHDSARYDDELAITVRAAEIGRTSLRFEIHVYRDDALLVAIDLTYVNAGRESHRAEPVPETIIERIVAFERTAPARR